MINAILNLPTSILVNWHQNSDRKLNMKPHQDSHGSKDHGTTTVMFAQYWSMMEELLKLSLINVLFTYMQNFSAENPLSWVLSKRMDECVGIWAIQKPGHPKGLFWSISCHIAIVILNSLDFYDPRCQTTLFRQAICLLPSTFVPSAKGMSPGKSTVGFSLPTSSRNTESQMRTRSDKAR